MKGKSLRDVIHQEDYENLVQLFKDTADSGRKNIFEVRVITLDNGFFWAAGIVEGPWMKTEIGTDFRFS